MFLKYLSYILFLFWVILPKCSFAQSSEEDLLVSLQSSDSEVHDSIYYELFKSSMGSDIMNARKYALLSLKTAKQFGDHAFAAKAYRAIAFTYNAAGKIDSARHYYQLGIEIAKRHKLDRPLMSLLTDLGILYDRQDSYDSALRFYNLALDIADKIESKDGQAAIRNNIGLVFYYLNNYDEALEYYQSALAIKRANGITDDIPLNLLNIAIVYNEQGKYNDAISNLNQVASICQDNCDINIEANLNYGLGLSYKKKKDFDKSLPFLVKGYELAKKGDIKNVLAYVQFHLNDFRFREGDYAGSIELLKGSEKIANQINLKRLKRDIYEAYTRVYDRTGDLTRVVEYQAKFIAMKDSIFNEKLASNLKEIQLDAQRKQSEVIIQQKDSEIQRVRLITGLVGVIAFLLVIVSVLIYRNYRASHRLKSVLEKEIKKRTGELVKSNENLIQMTQEYDQLVYRASHDIRGPLATLMGLTNIAKQDYTEASRVKDYLDKIGSTAMGLNQTLSQLMETNRIRNHPIVVEEIEIGALVDEVYGSFKTLNHFPLISFRIEKGDWSQPLYTDRNLVGFVLAKLLDNAFRYFSSYKDEKYIKISWSQSDDKTIIAVEDNGLGIDVKAKEKIFQLFYVASDQHGSGLGLFLAQMAANRLGGRVILARSSSPTIFKLVISSNLSKAQAEDKPFMTVAS